MEEEKEYKEVTFEEVKSGLESGSFTVIDVRNKEELIASGKIPKTINIPCPECPDVFKLPPENFKERVGIDKPEKDAKIVFHCRSGKRAIAALDNVADLGYSELFLYKGSFLDWEEKGGEVVKVE